MMGTGLPACRAAFAWRGSRRSVTCRTVTGSHEPMLVTASDQTSRTTQPLLSVARQG
jgi:hypothetical protein